MGRLLHFGHRDLYLYDHPELGHSLHDKHPDGSGICYSSRLRPNINCAPCYHSWLGGDGSSLYQYNCRCPSFRTWGQSEPRAGTAVLSATPSMPVRGQRAAIEISSNREMLLDPGLDAGRDLARITRFRHAQNRIARCDGEGEAQVLLDDQDGEFACAAFPPQHLRQAQDHRGLQAFDISSISRSRGLESSARAMISIFCSPPLSVPAGWRPR